MLEKLNNNKLQKMYIKERENNLKLFKDVIENLDLDYLT